MVYLCHLQAHVWSWFCRLQLRQNVGVTVSDNGSLQLTHLCHNQQKQIGAKIISTKKHAGCLIKTGSKMVDVTVDLVFWSLFGGFQAGKKRGWGFPTDKPRSVAATTTVIPWRVAYGTVVTFGRCTFFWGEWSDCHGLSWMIIGWFGWNLFGIVVPVLNLTCWWFLFWNLHSFDPGFM